MIVELVGRQVRGALLLIMSERLLEWAGVVICAIFCVFAGTTTAFRAFFRALHTDPNAGRTMVTLDPCGERKTKRITWSMFTKMGFET